MKLKSIALVIVFALLLSIGAFAAAPAEYDLSANSGIVPAGEGILLADCYNNVIWYVDSENVELYAGKIGPAGIDGAPVGFYADGPAGEAGFVSPWAIAPFMDGFAVSDPGANVIRYIDADGVHTAAGSGKAGLSNGAARTASFRRPTGLAADDRGNLYIADTDNGCIRKLTKNGTVSTYADGLVEPTGLCWANGSLYIAETGANRICRVVNGQAQVITGKKIAGEEAGVYVGGFGDGPADKAEFDHPQGVAVAGDGTVFIADTNNAAIRRLVNGRVSTFSAARGMDPYPVNPRSMLLTDEYVCICDPASLGLLLGLFSSESFNDVADGAWYAEAVRQAVERGLVSGMGDGSFAPDEKLNRAMFVTMLSRMEYSMNGSIVIDGDTRFADLNDDDWFAAEARWAADAGVVLGMNGSFCGKENITREQLVTMLYRYASAHDFNCSASAVLDDFSDAEAVSDYALEAMQWAVGAGMIKGLGDGTLAPQGDATRAEAVGILIAFMDAMGI